MGMTSARVTGLLLAAGAGRRFGGPKALVQDGQGSWLHRAVRALLDGGCGDVLVVTGAAADEVEAMVLALGHARVTTTRCGTWEAGMGESLRAGLTSLATRGRTVPAQALVHLVDLPDVGAGVVARVLASSPPGAAATGALVRAAYHGVPGHPVLLGQEHWQAVLDVARGDAGARSYLRAARPRLVECGDLATGDDVDVHVPTPPAPTFRMDAPRHRGETAPSDRDRRGPGAGGSMSGQPDRDTQGEELNPEGAGLGMDDEPNTFEPEEEPEATDEPEEG